MTTEGQLYVAASRVSAPTLFEFDDPGRLYTERRLGNSWATRVVADASGGVYAIIRSERESDPKSAIYHLDAVGELLFSKDFESYELESITRTQEGLAAVGRRRPAPSWSVSTLRGKSGVT